MILNITLILRHYKSLKRYKIQSTLYILEYKKRNEKYLQSLLLLVLLSLLLGIASAILNELINKFLFRYFKI